MIEKAIQISGRAPSLLDTQGTILLKMEKSEQAIQCLEEATAGGATDARFFLHLASAYLKSARPQDAVRMLKKSRALGLGTICADGGRPRIVVTAGEGLEHHIACVADCRCPIRKPNTELTPSPCPAGWPWPWPWLSR